MEQTEAVEHSSPCTVEEPHWLISVLGDSTSIQAKLQDMYCNKCSCLSLYYDITHYMVKWKKLQQPVMCVDNVAER